MDQAKLVANLTAIRARIADAARRSGRSSDKITLVAVTKYVDAEACRVLYEAGCRTLGESRPQSLWEKHEKLSPIPIQWHLIGHLQRNKARRTLPLVELIHSGDSLRLLNDINRLAAEVGRAADVLLEVNVSGDESKHGFRPGEMLQVIREAAQLGSVRIHGLMAMASQSGGSSQARRDFVALRELRESLSGDCPDCVKLDDLSMGMSGDFEIAIEEGATIVRVGSALFEDLDV